MFQHQKIQALVRSEVSQGVLMIKAVGLGKYLEMLDTPEQVSESNSSPDQKEQLTTSGRSWPGEAGSIPGGCHALRASAHKFSQFQELALLGSNTFTSLTQAFFVESECLFDKVFPTLSVHVHSNLNSMSNFQPRCEYGALL